MRPHPPPLDYDDHPAAPPRGRIFSNAAFLAGCIGYFILGVLLLFVVPVFERIFADFGGELPATTRWLFRFSRWFSDGGWLPLWIVPVALALIVPRLTPAGDRGQISFRWVFLVFTVTIAAALVILIVAVFLPMVGLIQTLSEPK